MLYTSQITVHYRSITILDAVILHDARFQMLFGESTTQAIESSLIRRRTKLAHLDLVLETINVGKKNTAFCVYHNSYAPDSTKRCRTKPFVYNSSCCHGCVLNGSRAEGITFIKARSNSRSTLTLSV